VLAVVFSEAKVRLGGPLGTGLELMAGDIVVLPAGISHARIASLEFFVVGAYPEGRSWDLRRGDISELAIILENLRHVPFT